MWAHHMEDKNMAYSISDFALRENTTTLFTEEYGLKDDDFVSTKNLIDKRIIVTAYRLFTKDDSEGVFILFECNGEAHYTVTHSIGIVKTFQNEAVQQAFEDGEHLEARIVERKSKTTGRKYLSII